MGSQSIDLDLARSVMHVEIPSLAGGYKAFYNPTGLGPEPLDGVRHTESGPADLEPVIIAIDDPMRFSRSIQQQLTSPGILVAQRG
jgi:hypothetical protein